MVVNNDLTNDLILGSLAYNISKLTPAAVNQISVTTLSVKYNPLICSFVTVDVTPSDFLLEDNCDMVTREVIAGIAIFNVNELIKFSIETPAL